MGRFPRPLVPLGQQAAVQPALAYISSVYALHLHRFTLDLPIRNLEVERRTALNVFCKIPTKLT